MLQDIAQKEKIDLPVYATYSSGPAHAPTFTSTVEFAGKLYRGTEQNTKKLAEMNAAAVAFVDFRNQEISFPKKAEMLLGNNS